MALTKEDNDRYLEQLKCLASSRTAVVYCIRNINRVPEAIYNNAVFLELERLSRISHDSINEVMSKVLMALFSRAEVAEEELSKGLEVSF